TSSGAAPAAAAPASSEPNPNATHFEASLRVGFRLPLGSAAGTASGGGEELCDWYTVTITLQLGIGARRGSAWFLGAYFSYGFGGSTDASICTGSCTPSTLRFGGQVHWHPLGNVATDPWVGLGSGYEKVQVSASDGNGSLSGWEFVNLQLGL